jgi:Dihydrouridine synthase (Dus)
MKIIMPVMRLEHTVSSCRLRCIRSRADESSTGDLASQRESLLLWWIKVNWYAFRKYLLIVQAWRILARRYGAELCYTPMIHARLYSLPNSGEHLRRRAFASIPSERPVIAQVCPLDFGSNVSFAPIILASCLPLQK